MSKARKHRRVIVLSKVDLALKATMSEAQIVVSNLDSSDDQILSEGNKSSRLTNIRNNVENISAGNEKISVTEKNNKIIEKEYGEVFSEKMQTRANKTSYKHRKKIKKPLTDHEQFLLEQCPPHYGKV